MSYQYKGYTIIGQFQRYAIWEIDSDGDRTKHIHDYEDLFDCYMIWDTDHGHQHPDFEDQFFDNLMEAKLAIDTLSEAA